MGTVILFDTSINGGSHKWGVLMTTVWDCPGGRIRLGGLGDGGVYGVEDGEDGDAEWGRGWGVGICGEDMGYEQSQTLIVTNPNLPSPTPLIPSPTPPPSPPHPQHYSDQLAQ